MCNCVNDLEQKIKDHVTESNSSDSFQRGKPWGKSAKIETPYRLPLMLLPHGLFIKDFIGRHVQR